MTNHTTTASPFRRQKTLTILGLACLTLPLVIGDYPWFAYPTFAIGILIVCSAIMSMKSEYDLDPDDVTPLLEEGPRAHREANRASL